MSGVERESEHGFVYSIIKMRKLRNGCDCESPFSMTGFKNM